MEQAIIHGVAFLIEVITSHIDIPSVIGLLAVMSVTAISAVALATVKSRQPSVADAVYIAVAAIALLTIEMLYIYLATKAVVLH